MEYLIQNYFSGLVAPLAQAASDTSSGTKPWQENFAIDAIVVGTCLLMVVLVWLWARSGRSKRENMVPFERTSEDFAGNVQAGYGRLPAFLWVLYAVVLISIALYVINAVITGPRY
ncbi:MAG TPA: hypothetical protein VH186_24205 [Chloroflexia bacterium]|nr:hypothetical protein [Chloroflexia bacterium]